MSSAKFRWCAIILAGLLTEDEAVDGQRDALVTILAFIDMDTCDRHPLAANDAAPCRSHAYGAVSGECA